MPSIVQGFEYDIFISYRHKDNKYDHWVTDFVDNLSKELESTFKHNISIYFDQNTNDGLHDTDDVDGSLEPKLKSLIFIPIVSQTYCDPGAFAWRNELLIFLKLADSDALGLKIRNPRGNVTSRVLPIRIHDLDVDDQKLFEEVTGGSFRPVDFVYRAQGVNRPLRSHEDAPKENQNHTYYRDQISKVAGAVKEVIGGIQVRKSGSLPAHQTRSIQKERPQKKISRLVWIATAALIVIVLAWVVVLTRHRTERATSETATTSKVIQTIAVLPFADMSAAHDQEYFGDGLSEELLNVLSKIPGLLVTARTSAFSFKGKKEDVREIGKKLNVAYILEGSVRKDGDLVRITTQLINTATGSHIWSNTYDREMKNIFVIQDEIAQAVADQLRLKIQLSGVRRPRESDPMMYQAWLAAHYHYNLGTTKGDSEAYVILKRAYEKDSTDARVTSLYAMLTTGLSRFAGTVEKTQEQMKLASALGYKAIRLDSNYVTAYVYTALMRLQRMDFETGKKLLEKAVELGPNYYFVIANLGFQKSLFGDFKAAEALYKKCILLDPLNANAYAELCRTLLQLNRYEEAVAYGRKAVSISPWNDNYDKLAKAYLLAGKPDSALVCVSIIGPGEFWQRFYESLACWSQGKRQEANNHLEWIIEHNSHDGAFQIAEIYAWQGDKEKSIHWLERAVKQKDTGMFEVNLSPFFNHDKDPRYIKILRNMGLPIGT